MALWHKIKENIFSVLPVIIIVLLLHATVAPLSGETLQRFFLGSSLLIVGLSIFLIGAEMGILPMGEFIGSALSKERRIWLIILISFAIGFGITVAEPDVQVLAEQVNMVEGGPSSKTLLIGAVAGGVGLFIIAAMLKTIFNFPLSIMVICSYIVVFVLATFTSTDYLSVAFDSGGVTTGPMTVPLILALGVGVASVRGGQSNQEDSFGFVGLASIGPILAVMLMGVLYK